METTDNHLLKLLEKVGEIYATTTTPKLGRPYDFIELVMLKVFLLMVLKKIKQFAALYRYLEAHPEARAACGLERMPDESTIRPIWAEVATNSKADAKVAAELKENLPSHTRRVLGDEAYDDPKLRAGIERYENHLLTRCLLVPIEVKKRTPGRRQREADRHQREREIYRRRSVSIEPFLDRLDQVFDIEPAWMKGLANNRSLGLLWVAGYLLPMLHQVARGMNPSMSRN